MSDTSTESIQDANDRFRGGDQTVPGQWVITQGLAATIEEAGLAALDVI
ncbi:MAG: hypothetical protein AAFN09_16065 [Pseudomonadota bacterium]